MRVRRPIEVVVLNACVTETKETPWASNTSTILAKSSSERVSRSILYTTTMSTLDGANVGQKALQGWPLERPCPTSRRRHSELAAFASPRLSGW